MPRKQQYTSLKRESVEPKIKMEPAEGDATSLSHIEGSLEDGEITGEEGTSVALPSSIAASIPIAASSITLALATSSIANKSSPMTPAELDQAKDTVLDLLGWGVTPEYLVECGVSSHALYKIFTDLRLRLPRNLSLNPIILAHREKI